MKPVHLDDETHHRAKVAAAEDKRTVQDIVREAVKQWLDERDIIMGSVS